jgi:putative ABC transport system ATP-binding protein
MLQVTDIKKIFQAGDRKVAAVNGVSFKVEQGQFASIVGQSGSGKTTLMSLLGGLDKPTSGSIEVDGKDIANMHDHQLIDYRSKQVGFVFQSYNLVPNLTARENVMLPMEAARVPTPQRKERAGELLRAVGFTDDQMKRKPGKLSGGQQQRVAIARALANRPKLLLADEPTGNLDSQTGEMIFELLINLTHNLKTTVIIVTHDLPMAKQADVMFQLKDGKLVKDQ